MSKIFRQINSLVISLIIVDFTEIYSHTFFGITSVKVTVLLRNEQIADLTKGADRLFGAEIIDIHEGINRVGK